MERESFVGAVVLVPTIIVGRRITLVKTGILEREKKVRGGKAELKKREDTFLFINQVTHFQPMGMSGSID